MLAFPALVLAFIIVAVGLLFPYLAHEFINLKELTGG
jgi:hypothetical protein